MAGRRAAEPPGARRGCGAAPVDPAGGQTAAEGQGRASVSDGVARQEGLLWGAGPPGERCYLQGGSGFCCSRCHTRYSQHGAGRPLKGCFCRAG